MIDKVTKAERRLQGACLECGTFKKLKLVANSVAWIEVCNQCYNDMTLMMTKGLGLNHRAISKS